MILCVVKNFFHQSLGCLAYLLPYMEQTGASSLITTDMTVDPVKPWWCGDPSTVTASKTRVRSFLCPSVATGQDPTAIAFTTSVYGAGPNNPPGWDNIGWFSDNPSVALISASGRTNYLGCAGLLEAVSKPRIECCEPLGTNDGGR